MRHLFNNQAFVALIHVIPMVGITLWLLWARHQEFYIPILYPLGVIFLDIALFASCWLVFHVNNWIWTKDE